MHRRAAAIHQSGVPFTSIGIILHVPKRDWREFMASAADEIARTSLGAIHQTRLTLVGRRSGRSSTGDSSYAPARPHHCLPVRWVATHLWRSMAGDGSTWRWKGLQVVGASIYR